MRNEKCFEDTLTLNMSLISRKFLMIFLRKTFYEYVDRIQGILWGLLLANEFYKYAKKYDRCQRYSYNDVDYSIPLQCSFTLASFEKWNTNHVDYVHLKSKYMNEIIAAINIRQNGLRIKWW